MRFLQVDGEQGLEDWRRVHNEIIPTDPLSLDEVRERSGRHHLEVAYLGDEAVGNSTVRRPTDDEGAMVIARVRPPYRRQGLGTFVSEAADDRSREIKKQRARELVQEALREATEAGLSSKDIVELFRSVLHRSGVKRHVATRR